MGRISRRLSKELAGVLQVFYDNNMFLVVFKDGCDKY